MVVPSFVGNETQVELCNANKRVHKQPLLLEGSARVDPSTPVETFAFGLGDVLAAHDVQVSATPRCRHCYGICFTTVLKRDITRPSPLLRHVFLWLAGYQGRHSNWRASYIR